MDKAAILERYKELDDQIAPFCVFSFVGMFGNGDSKKKINIPNDFIFNWLVKAKNLVANTCGEDSQHFKTIEKIEDRIDEERTSKSIMRLYGAFSAAKDDFAKGYIFNIRDIVQSDVFNDELSQATELLECNYVLAAAVIAGTVLETKLRCLCDKYSLPHGKLDKMNSELVKKGAYNVNLQKKITALAGIRNSAAHGKEDEFDKDAVSMMIIDIKNFLDKQDIAVVG